MAVVAYLRVSTEKQFLENQREEIIRFAENLEKKLLWAGVEAKRIYMTENKNGARQLIMALSAKSARCISMKLVCERIEEVLGKRMVLCANQPLLVSSVTRWVRFEEECPYFVLLDRKSVV